MPTIADIYAALKKSEEEMMGGPPPNELLEEILGGSKKEAKKMPSIGGFMGKYDPQYDPNYYKTGESEPQANVNAPSDPNVNMVLKQNAKLVKKIDELQAELKEVLKGYKAMEQEINRLRNVVEPGLWEYAGSPKKSRFSRIAQEG